jgi:hypothetical protein
LRITLWLSGRNHGSLTKIAGFSRIQLSLSGRMRRHGLLNVSYAALPALFTITKGKRAKVALSDSYAPRAILMISVNQSSAGAKCVFTYIAF